MYFSPNVNLISFEALIKHPITFARSASHKHNFFEFILTIKIKMIYFDAYSFLYGFCCKDTLKIMSIRVIYTYKELILNINSIFY